MFSLHEVREEETTVKRWEKRAFSWKITKDDTSKRKYINKKCFFQFSLELFSSFSWIENIKRKIFTFSFSSLVTVKSAHFIVFYCLFFQRSANRLKISKFLYRYFIHTINFIFIFLLLSLVSFLLFSFFSLTQILSISNNIKKHLTKGISLCDLFHCQFFCFVKEWEGKEKANKRRK